MHSKYEMNHLLKKGIHFLVYSPTVSTSECCGLRCLVNYYTIFIQLTVYTVFVNMVFW